MKYILFTLSGEGLPVALHLKAEGYSVVVGQIEDYRDTLTPDELTGAKPEGAEEKKRRLSLGDGLIEKHPADKLLKAMAKLKNKDEYFVITDLNLGFKYATAAKALGFKGNYPSLEDRILEVDRNAAKDFVKKHYTGLSVAEVQEFKSAADAIAMLQESEDMWVLKGLSDDAPTVVPETEEPELANQQLIDALEADPGPYEKAGFILELRIANPIEITPELVYWNGERIACLVDIENKPMGGGNVGPQTGCSQDLVFPIPLDSKIVSLAFPKIVDKMAKERGGLFVWDASILMDQRTGKLYFGEFCPNRFGYNAFYTELTLAGSVGHYFDAITRGESPFTEGTFASSVRVLHMPNNLNMPERIDPSKTLVDTPIGLTSDEHPHLWLMDVLSKDNKLVTAGYEFSTACATGVGSSITEAAESAYQALTGFNMDDSLWRTADDYLSTGYPSSIPNRFQAGNHNLYELPDFDGESEQMAMLRKDRAAMAQEKKALDRERKALQQKHDQRMKQVDAEMGALRDQVITLS